MSSGRRPHWAPRRGGRIAEPRDRWWELRLVALLFPGLLALAVAGAYLVILSGGQAGISLVGVAALLLAAGLASHLTPADRRAMVRLGSVAGRTPPRAFRRSPSTVRPL